MAERRDLPLFAWSEAVRAARRQRCRLLLRGVTLSTGCCCVVATIVAPPMPRLVWNASASAPLGLYAIAPRVIVRRGDMVIARTPIGVRDLAARRRYVPANVPLVKRAVGIAGDRICAAGMIVTLNGRFLARRRTTDVAGRPLPWWSGCQTLRGGALFLLMAETPDSFDGRYFGPTESGDVIGKATALWVADASRACRGARRCRGASAG